ncbi:Putative SANT/Myb domain, Homeobox-like domain superfamily protein [Septoria linicola]|uniref:SANT/Myb domain, Homeobox-like domain superfamily protein n=2 Tax=Mycosphaerellaceae TaxID=93133 RepID=A0A9Q9AJ51_9PEZI|nr:putative SANT/Myb domain, Homeobox-like domain superfamily protein [Septoria linicola]USW50000.1 Putative SANT/Myb domain, Homeobox-like domain superfamily protein [Septoria linicola]
MQTMHYPPQHYPPGPPPPQYHPMTNYSPYPPTSMPDPRLAMSIPISHAGGSSNKRLAPPHPHPSETPAKKKQSKWTADEDRSIIELRGNGMKWEDISKHLPGRSAISCRLRFQNYLERRSEWDEEKKNKLARLYERFKKDMWEKISKEMQLPWRAAEAMHWQIGEVEMAQRANVPVFHLAGQPGSGVPPPGAGSEGRASTSPSSGGGAQLPGMAYSHTHNHSLPTIPQPLSHPVSPMQSRLRRNSDNASPHGSLRHRADSARSVPNSGTLSRAPLPPLHDVTGAPSNQMRYTLPPVSTTSENLRR